MSNITTRLQTTVEDKRVKKQGANVRTLIRWSTKETACAWQPISFKQGVGEEGCL